MNKADNEAGNAAIDSLLNYETVKVGHLSKIYITFVCSLASNAEVWKPVCTTE